MNAKSKRDKIYIRKIREAQDVAFRMANLNSKKITIEEIQEALVVLANFAEDVLFKLKEDKQEK